MKTVAIKVDDELHAQLLLVAQLEGKTLTDVIREAVETYVAALRKGNGLAAKAKDLLEAIDSETAAKKQAVQGLLSQLESSKPDGAPKRSRRGSAAKPST